MNKELLDKLTGRDKLDKPKRVFVSAIDKTEHEFTEDPQMLRARIECELKNIEMYEMQIAKCQEKIDFYESVLEEIEG